MSGKMNWDRVKVEERMRVRGVEAHEDYQPRPHDGPVPKSQQSPASQGKIMPAPAKKQKLAVADAKEDRRKNYLREVCKAISEGKTPPAPFRKLAPEVKAAIAAAQSIEVWARKQPEYKALVRFDAELRVKDPTSNREKWIVDVRKQINLLERELKELDQRKKEVRAELEKKMRTLRAIT